MSQEFKQVPVRTAAEIVSQTERLAALLMKEFHGREATSENVLCHTSEDPRAQHAWKVACLMQIELTETDPDDALSELEEDEESLVAMPAQDVGFLVVQEGGSSSEMYVHGFDTGNEAESYRAEAANRASGRTGGRSPTGIAGLAW